MFLQLQLLPPLSPPYAAAVLNTCCVNTDGFDNSPGGKAVCRDQVLSQDK